ncbi:SMP-30/gluconolactonase/LRE family protein [Fibrella aquatilis]|uniref:SMP-30/gluconolactonase/LRE family protein n=1 Tax=Fibrella aquatilis TaxID=2817059 RepID=A0A939G7U8_9BACT|nr:SMP-30/gluconolactonase/LRE family protein [Fibrella aquatilis]MBO0931980.1 SMP-30/gluconolactonase/LRE family protein [Fibrella aquatilis]
MQISTFWQGNNQLGEGPYWDQANRCLWWVDILGKTIFRATERGDAVQQWLVPELVGFALPRPDGTHWLGYQSGLHVGKLHPDGTLTTTRVDAFTDHADRLRFNDGCVDSAGNLYATTMDMQGTEPLGTLRRYAYSTNAMTVLSTGYVVGNGPALSLDESVLYMVETIGHAKRPKAVYAAQLTQQGLTPDRLIIVWPDADTYPDGVCTDQAGNLWVGEWGGTTLRQFLPDGMLLHAIALPVMNPTKVAIDPRTNGLLVTTARVGLTTEQLATYPLTGSVLLVG